MTSEESSNLETVSSYLAALEGGSVGDALARFFTPDAVQIELPNSLNPAGGRSDLETLLKRAEQGQHILAKQTYIIRSEMAQGSRVAVEALWTGIIKVQIGSLQPGAEMKAHFAMFFELVDGRIASQRNYDCFETRITQ
jgi:limonene-1,2-epoxide hydrolase